MALAPVLVSVYSAGGAVRIAAAGCAAGAAIAGIGLIRRSSGHDLLYVPDHAPVETNRAAIGGAAGAPVPPALPPPVPLAAAPLGEWPVGRRPAAVEAPPTPIAPAVPASIPMNGVVPPLELIAPAGRRRWLRELVENGPVVLVLSVNGGDDERDALVLELRDEGIGVAVITPTGDGHSYTCPLAFETLVAPHGGVFMIDRGCRLRLAFAATEPGQWIAASIVRGRLRRMVAA